MKNLELTYTFALPDGGARAFKVMLDPDTALLPPPSADGAPAWTRLEFQQCSGCPLSIAEHSHCPVALHLADVMEGFADLVSYDQVTVAVKSEDRTVTAQLSAQQGLASFMGLLIASSGCPRTAVFRPMARFHLPFSSEAETAYRVAAMYLMAQHFVARDGGEPDVELRNFERVYQGVHAVNRGMAQRLRAASRQDAILNALVLLDVYTSLVPAAIHDILEELKPTFAALLAPEQA